MIKLVEWNIKCQDLRQKIVWVSMLGRLCGGSGNSCIPKPDQPLPILKRKPCKNEDMLSGFYSPVKKNLF